MYTNRVILKLKIPNSTVQHYAVLNIWSQTRNINFLQKCKDCFNALLKNPAGKEAICEVSESCCSARGVLEPSHDSPAVAPCVHTQYGANVVIIGAGMAGLSAANHLHDNGIENVTVLEALNRPGGRIQSAWFGDSVIELGSPIGKIPATNPIVQNVFEDGLTKLPLNQADPSRGLLHRSDGSAIPYPITYEVYNIFKEILAEANAIDESGESRESKIKFIGSRIEQEVRVFPTNFEVDAQRVFHGLACVAMIRSNHDSSLIKTNNFGAFIQLPGSKIKVPLGHFGEVNTLYHSLPKNSVKFGKSVVKIRWGGVSNVFPRAVVICEDGESYETDYVIITLPVGVLKELSDTLFCPGLPASKLNAVLKIPQEYTSKIFLQFPQPFWMWNKDFKKIIFDAESMKCKEGWLKGLCSVEPIKGSSHVVCLSVAGPEAQCLETTSDVQIIGDVVALLKELTKKKVPDPVSLKRTSWSNDPHFLGSYSYMGPDVSSKDFYDLASPLPEHSEYCDPVLLFAGEASCPVHYGTVRGAKASGVREAERLIQLIRLQDENEKEEEIKEMKIQCNF